MVVNRWKRILSRLRSLKLTHRSLRSLKRAVWLCLPFAIAMGVSLTVAAHALSTSAPLASGSTLTTEERAIAPPAPVPLQPHPLPPALARWSASNAGDYFDQIEVVPVNYLVWSHFPLTVYLPPPTATELASPFTAQRSQAWVTAVLQAVQEWNHYLPLMVVDQADGADIAVLRSPPPLQVEASTNQDATGLLRERPTLRISRARSAVTTYKVYVKGLKEAASKPMLALRCTIRLRPDQAPQYLQAAVRHELGHALGLWGHSRSPTDVMYFSQVRNPPPISPRDLNTLKRIYEQPTRLGWALSE